MVWTRSNESHAIRLFCAQCLRASAKSCQMTKLKNSSKESILERMGA